MKLSSSLKVLLFTAALTSVGAVSSMAQDASARLDRLERDIETLNRAVYTGQPPVAPVSVEGMDTSARASLEIRLNQIEMELRNLTGTMEQQQHQIRMMKDKLDKFMVDTDLRLQDQSAVNGYNGSQTTNGPSMITGPKNFGAQPSTNTSTQPVAQGLPQTLGTLPASSVNQAPAFQAASDAGSASPTGVYEYAFGLIREGQYDKAQTEFVRFLKDFPNHALASNANYWLGETHYVRGNYPRAAQIFAKGYQENPKGSKAADNLLKLSLSLEGMGKKEDACITLRQLEKEFTADESPIIIRARQELDNLGCN